MLKLLREATGTKALLTAAAVCLHRMPTWHDPLQPASAADGCQKYQSQQFFQPSFRFRLALIITFVDLAQLQAPQLHHPVPRAWLGDLWFQRRRTRG